MDVTYYLEDDNGILIPHDLKCPVFVNTQEFRREALYFLQEKDRTGTGKYPCGEPDTDEYDQYWEEQEKRCIYGYSVGGVKITGDHYFYLNFCQIRLTDEENTDEVIVKKGKRAGQKITTFPDFWDGDYIYFHLKEIARRNGKHLCIGKARRKGYSFKNGSIAARRYKMFAESTTLFLAYDKKYLFSKGKGIMVMTKQYVDFINKNTAWARTKITDQQDWIKDGVVTNINGVNVEEGFLSEIMAISAGGNPDVSRGKDGALVIIEESGKFPNLDDTMEATTPIVEDGVYVTGQIIMFGCVCAGTKVWTAKGEMINVEDLKQEDGILGFNTHGVSVEPITWMQPISEKPCYRITTSTGRTLECSEDHPILWSNVNYEYRIRKYENGERIYKGRKKKVIFKETKDIKIGDQVGVINSLSFFGTTPMWKPRLVGMLIGDGSYGFDKTPVFSNCDDVLTNLVLKYTDAIVEKEYKTTEGKNYKEIRIKGITKELRELGIYGQTGNNKRLPKNLHLYDRKSLAKLIAGLFDTDGTVVFNTKGKYSTPSVSLTSSCYELLLEVKQLCYKFGIHGSITTIKPSNRDRVISDKNDYYRFVIADNESILSFYKNIPILIDYKKQKLQQIINANNQTRQANSVVMVNKRDSHKSYVDLVDVSGLRFETVKNIEFIGNKPIYNLTAGNTHTYLANGIITHNTGGGEDNNWEHFENYFYNPESNNFLPIRNDWDNDVPDAKCGYFHPDYLNKKGYYDTQGNSFTSDAIAFEQIEREKKEKKSRSILDVVKYKMERPFSPKEAFARSSVNIFPVEQLDVALKRLEHGDIDKKIGITVDLIRNDKGQMRSRMNEHAPVLSYPIQGDTTGTVVIYNAPVRIDGIVPDNLYFICHDPYAFDQAEGPSIGAAYVIMNPNNYDLTKGDLIVATYIARPNTQDDYNKILFDLAEYYNAKIGFENDRGDVIGYAKRFKKLHFLTEEFELAFDEKFGVSKVRRGYGMHMGSGKMNLRKMQGDKYIADWLITPRITLENENQLLNLDVIYDRGLLLELIKYKPDKNFDRVSALRIGMYYFRELQYKGTTPEKAKTKSKRYAKNLVRRLHGTT